MPRPFLIFSQSDYLIQNSYILFTYLMANSADPDQLASSEPTDLDLHCLQRQDISWFSRTRVKPFPSPLPTPTPTHTRISFCRPFQGGYFIVILCLYVGFYVINYQCAAVSYPCLFLSLPLSVSLEDCASWSFLPQLCFRLSFRKSFFA